MDYIFQNEYSRKARACLCATLWCVVAVFSVLLLDPSSALPSSARPQDKRRVLRTVREVHQLSNIEARDAYLVQVEGIATYSDPEWGLLFVQDDTGGIYVNVHGVNTSYPVGARIRVDAVTGPGDVGAVLVNPRIQVVGAGALPVPERHTLSELNARAADSRYIQTQGVLRAGDQPWNRICFRIFDGNNSALVVAPLPNNPQARRLVGATVRLHGVSGVHIDAQGKILGAMVFVNGLEDIEVQGGAARDPNALAVIVHKSNPVTDLSVTDFRRILLGEQKHWTGSQNIVVLVPAIGTPERETLLRFLGMDEAAYKKCVSEKSGTGSADAGPVSTSTGFAINVVADNPAAIAIVPIGEVRGTVKLISIEGHLPSDPAYPVH